jgi:short-subunit dehydrogenase
MMFHYQGKTALITGASSGIGAAFARALAARGMHVILVARAETTLRSMADDFAVRHKIRAEVVPVDLSRDDAAREVAATIAQRGLSVDLLVNNAGFTTFGRFEDLTLERDHAQVMVNITALVDLTHAFVPAMLARGNGGIINVASIAAFMPSPYQVVYPATKAFVLTFSYGLHAALQRRGIQVLAVCPGAVATNFFEAGQAPEIRAAARLSGGARTPEQVVATSLRAFEAGKSMVIDGRINAATVALARLLPRSLLAQIVGRVTRPQR